MDDYDYEEEYEEEKSENKSGIIPILDLIATWFIRIGLGIGVILLLYFMFSGKFLEAILYIIGLVFCYFFGYFFMFCLDTFLSKD